jgi:hypothetical protein
MRGCGEYCVMALRSDDGPNRSLLILCNAIGAPVDSKQLEIEPTLIVGGGG